MYINKWAVVLAVVAVVPAIRFSDPAHILAGLAAVGLGAVFYSYLWLGIHRAATAGVAKVRGSAEGG